MVAQPLMQLLGKKKKKRRVQRFFLKWLWWTTNPTTKFSSNQKECSSQKKTHRNMMKHVYVPQIRNSYSDQIHFWFWSCFLPHYAPTCETSSMTLTSRACASLTPFTSRCKEKMLLLTLSFADVGQCPSVLGEKCLKSHRCLCRLFCCPDLSEMQRELVGCEAYLSVNLDQMESGEHLVMKGPYIPFWRATKNIHSKTIQ